MSNIQNDFKVGEEGEQNLIDLLNPYFPSYKNVDINSRGHYDIISEWKPGVNFTTEVKNDVYANKSGNWAIEVYNPKSDKYSGLSLTQSDFWCHITDSLYITPTKILKAYILDHKPYRVIECGGDNNATLYLYKAEIIKVIFKELNKKNIKDIMTELLYDL